MTVPSLKYMKWGFVLLFFNINLGSSSGSLDLLPDFLGMLLLLISLRKRLQETDTEKRLEPLLLLLSVDYFLHFFLTFSNGVESLFVTVISIYAIYVYLSETRKRIQGSQPQLAQKLEAIAVSYVVLLMIHYICGAYELVWITMALTIAFIILLIAMLTVLFRIVPQESIDEYSGN